MSKRSLFLLLFSLLISSNLFAYEVIIPFKFQSVINYDNGAHVSLITNVTFKLWDEKLRITIGENIVFEGEERELKIVGENETIAMMFPSPYNEVIILDKDSKTMMYCTITDDFNLIRSTERSLCNPVSTDKSFSDNFDWIKGLYYEFYEGYNEQDEELDEMSYRYMIQSDEKHSEFEEAKHKRKSIKDEIRKRELLKEPAQNTAPKFGLD